VKRGEIWWAAMAAPAGRRPVVLLSRDEAYAVRELVTVAPVTQRIRDLPVEVALDVEDGLPRACVANLDTVTTIPKHVLEERLTTLSPAKMREIEHALRFALQLDD
jgi:mRNA interferase MazF